MIIEKEVKSLKMGGKEKNWVGWGQDDESVEECWMRLH